MTDWKKHWDAFPRGPQSDDLLRQVGKTVGGVPISEAQLSALLADIQSALQLDSGDHLLDLGCGNGLVTARCATRCAGALGVDFSAPLIAIARDRFASPSIRWLEGDVCALPAEALEFPATKCLMYEALQHLSLEQAHAMLEQLARSRGARAPLLLGSVPDAERLWDFYNTPERRADHERRVAAGTEAIGHWWTRPELESLAARSGRRLEIRHQDPQLHTAHYRFDVLLHR